MRYVMEFCDMTLKNYYDKNNNKMLFYTRKRIAQQFLYGISYLQHKKILHRDISVNNVLLKKYDAGVIGIKLSDFGLVKKFGSDFTQTDTELKGTVIDPALDLMKNYSLENEIYAIGMMLNYIFTGKKNYKYQSDCTLSEVVTRCTNSDLNKRYKTIQEIVKEIDLITESDIK